MNIEKVAAPGSGAEARADAGAALARAVGFEPTPPMAEHGTGADVEISETEPESAGPSAGDGDLDPTASPEASGPTYWRGRQQLTEPIEDLGLDPAPDYADLLPLDLVAEPAAFRHATHIEFLDREECDMIHMDRSGSSWRSVCLLTEQGYYLSGVREVRELDHPWAFFVNAVSDDVWSEVRIMGVSAPEARAILRAAGWEDEG